ncbi:hypothetical protein DL93DRAFT_2079370 [Clavulina sp. PMI_390]|nr:hypothetical protein DL93DRAFT_2079370 [Clavulina sp. PMI_390]
MSAGRSTSTARKRTRDSDDESGVVNDSAFGGRAIAFGPSGVVSTHDKKRQRLAASMKSLNDASYGHLGGLVSPPSEFADGDMSSYVGARNVGLHTRRRATAAPVVSKAGDDETDDTAVAFWSSPPPSPSQNPSINPLSASTSASSAYHRSIPAAASGPRIKSVRSAITPVLPTRTTPPAKEVIKDKDDEDDEDEEEADEAYDPDEVALDIGSDSDSDEPEAGDSDDADGEDTRAGKSHASSSSSASVPLSSMNALLHELHFSHRRSQLASPSKTLSSRTVVSNTKPIAPSPLSQSSTTPIPPASATFRVPAMDRSAIAAAREAAMRRERLQREEEKALAAAKEEEAAKKTVPPPAVEQGNVSQQYEETNRLLGALFLSRRRRANLEDDDEEEL